MADGSAGDEYELLPHEELENLRKELNKIKRNPLGSFDGGGVLLSKIDALTSSLNRLISILESAEKGMLEDFRKANPSQKLNEVLGQNQKIAQGIVALADMLKRMSPPSASPSSQMQSQPKLQFQSPFSPQRQMNQVSDQFPPMPLPPGFSPLSQQQQQSQQPSQQQQFSQQQPQQANDSPFPPPPMPSMGQQFGQPFGQQFGQQFMQPQTDFSQSSIPPPPTKKGLFGRSK